MSREISIPWDDLTAEERRAVQRVAEKAEARAKAKPTEEKKGRTFGVAERTTEVRQRGCTVKARVTKGGRIAAIDRPARVNVRGGPRHLEGLHDYQKKGVLWLRARRSALLGDDFRSWKILPGALRAP